MSCAILPFAPSQADLVNCATPAVNAFDGVQHHDHTSPSGSHRRKAHRWGPRPASPCRPCAANASNVSRPSLCAAAAVMDAKEVGAAQDDQRHPRGDLGGDQPNRAGQRARGKAGAWQDGALGQHGHRRPDGFVTLPCREREVSAPQELSGRCDCGSPRGHRDTAKRAVRLGGDEMALDVEGIVDGGVCGKKFLG